MKHPPGLAEPSVAFTTSEFRRLLLESGGERLGHIINPSAYREAHHRLVSMLAAAHRAKPDVRRFVLRGGLVLPDNTRLPARVAAQRCGLSAKTLQHMRLRGDGPPFEKVGARVFDPEQEFEAWLASRRRRSTSEAAP